ncbi:MAG: hypothetical protein HY452_00670 [Parcubacteria group bacterium]|nr:hypothetical protein [Parcubacteria group bacterium]
MEIACICREILKILAERSGELELNTRIWPRLQAQGVSWAKMKEVLSQLAEAGLITVQERMVVGNRRAPFYQMTAAGSQKLNEVSKPKGKKGNADATSFCGESCCINKAA